MQQPKQHGMHMPAQHGARPMGGMASSTDLLDPMSQEASGTAWLPSSTPMYGWMYMFGPNMLMLHGDVHLRYTDVGSQRGDRRIDAPNWFMGMYSHPLGPNDQLGLRAMFSLDPLTEGGRGYPLLFQTGETWHHQPLHDRQHPHDLVDELAAAYSHRLKENFSASLYLGYPGEPALGPPTYMHRLIAYDLADAPIGHHWQDSTHITFGVVTAGLNYASRWKLEGSIFNGREPDENRYNLDPARFDSYSGRLSYNPGPNHAFQVSYGFINNPEGDGVPQHRMTASWLYNRPLGTDANFDTALVWGRNILPTEGSTDSFLLDADYQHGRDTLFGRIEQIRKSGAELVLPAPYDTQKFQLGEYTFGYLRDLTHGPRVDMGVGAAFTVNTKPGSLDPFYGAGTPVSFQVFLRLRPSRMDMGPAMRESENPPVGMTASAGLGISAAMTPDPPRVGAANRMVVTVMDSTGKPVTGAKVTSEVGMTSMNMGTGRPLFRDLGDGRYEGSPRFSMPGPWRVRLTVTPPQGKPATRSFDYTVGP